MFEVPRFYRSISTKLDRWRYKKKKQILYIFNEIWPRSSWKSLAPKITEGESIKKVRHFREKMDGKNINVNRRENESKS